MIVPRVPRRYNACRYATSIRAGRFDQGPRIRPDEAGEGRRAGSTGGQLGGPLLRGPERVSPLGRRAALGLGAGPLRDVRLARLSVRPGNGRAAGMAGHVRPADLPLEDQMEGHLRRAGRWSAARLAGRLGAGLLGVGLLGAGALAGANL